MSLSPDDELGHGDIEAALAARRELGARYDAELVDGFAERIERAVERRVGEQVAIHERRTAATSGAGHRQMVLGLVSLGVGIPVTAINMAGVDDPSLVGLVVSWAGIAVVNVAHAWQSRRP